MSVATIENELINMTDAERQSVVRIATKMIENNRSRRRSLEEKRQQLRASAEFAAELYKSNKELTVWTDLDGEDIIDAAR